MATRCTPEERLVDPCQCALGDCLKDIGEAARAQRKVVFDTYYAIDPPPAPGPYLGRLEEIKLIEKAGYAECSAEGERSNKSTPANEPTKVGTQGGSHIHCVVWN